MDTIIMSGLLSVDNSIYKDGSWEKIENIFIFQT